jgi:hypothetical protein
VELKKREADESTKKLVKIDMFLVNRDSSRSDALAVEL